MRGVVLMQSSCPTPVGTPYRAMLPGDALHLNMPSADVSPQAAFGALDPESLAALRAAFHNSLAELMRTTRSAYGLHQRKACLCALLLSIAWRGLSSFCMCLSRLMQVRILELPCS